MQQFVTNNAIYLALIMGAGPILYTFGLYVVVGPRTWMANLLGNAIHFAHGVGVPSFFLYVVFVPLQELEVPQLVIDSLLFAFAYHIVFLAVPMAVAGVVMIYDGQTLPRKDGALPNMNKKIILEQGDSLMKLKPTAEAV